MATKPPTPPPGNNRPPKFEQPPKGKFIHSTFQTPKAVEMFRDEVQVIHKEIDAPGYQVGTPGDLHPDQFNFKGYVLNVIIPAEDGKTAKWVYTIPRDPLVGYSTNQVKQVETATQTLVNQSDPVPAADALTDIKREDLANTKALQTVTTIPDVFEAETFATSIPDVVPERFRVAVPTSDTSSISAGTAAPPALNTGDLAASAEQVTEFTVKNSLKTRAGITLPKSLSSYKVTQEGQVASVTETLDNGLQTITPSALTVEGEVQNLGNGTSLKTDTEVGSVFPANTYITDRQDFRELPPEFRARLPELATTVISAGTASQPSLNTGDLQASSEQLTEFKVKSGRKVRDLSGLPITLTDTRVTKEGQVETIARTLDTAPQTVSTGATVIESEVHDLGDGMNLKTVGTVPDVFPAGDYEISIPNAIPIEFRALSPTVRIATTSAGTANSTPALGFGEIAHKEVQVNEFTKRVEVETLGNTTLPVTLLGQETTKVFGGGIADVSRILGTDPLTADAGLTVLESKVQNLGNGYKIKETIQLEDSAWPALSGTEIDDRLNAAIPISKQTVIAGTTGGITGFARTEVTPLDKWRSEQITRTIPSDLSSLNRNYPTVINHAFPDTLTSATLDYAYASNSGGTVYAFGIQYTLLKGYHGPCDGRIYEIYTYGPPATLPSVTKFFPLEERRAISASSASDSQLFAHVWEFDFPYSLHDAISVTNGGKSMILTATNPIALPYGSDIVIEAQIEHWKYGIFITKVFTVTVPVP